MSLADVNPSRSAVIKLDDPGETRQHEGSPAGQEQAVAIAYANEATRSKQPPPETAASIRTRGLVIAAFWAVVIFFGLPIWWATTAIYRANLPLAQMLDWAEGRACRPVFPLRISIDPGLLQEQEAQYLLRSTQHALDDLNDFSAHHLRLQLSPHKYNDSQHVLLLTSSQEEEVALLIKLFPGESTKAFLLPYEPTLNVYYTPSQIPTSPSSSTSLATYIASQLREVFAEEQAMVAYLLATSSSPPERSSKAVVPAMSDALARRTTRSLKYSRNYHLTFSLFTPTNSPSSWDIDAALETHVKPLLDSFSSISNFTIDTQIQLYATPGVEGDILKKEDLSGFINAAEWPLSPAIGGFPTINFILYIGDMQVEGGAKSWLIPQWGGVVIQPNVDDLAPAMQKFTAQLLALLGLPKSTTLPLRLATLTRIHAASLLLSASSTLGSLARLTLALPSISIPESVASGVSTTLHHLELACGSSSSPPTSSLNSAGGSETQGLGGLRALEHARIAQEHAEKAFFEKSMVGQVYFPDEHKVAVYLPLLGPIGVPLVMGALKEIKAWKGRRRGIVV